MPVHFESAEVSHNALHSMLRIEWTRATCFLNWGNEERHDFQGREKNTTASLVSLRID